MTKIFQFCHNLGCFCHGFCHFAVIDILYQKNVTEMSPSQNWQKVDITTKNKRIHDKNSVL